MNLAQVHDFLNGPSARAVDTAGLTRASGTVQLPGRGPFSMPLPEALTRRRSGYRYGPMSLADLGTLLGWAAGPQRVVRGHQLTMAPSAGGLPSLDVYVIAREVSGVHAGIHHYARTNGTLSALLHGDPSPALRSVLIQPEFADRVAAMLVVVARLDTTLVKYPVRHYRTLHVDAGILVQNLYLVSTALGLTGCAVAGYDDAAVTSLLSLDDTAFPAMLFAVGRPSAKSVRQ
jgi:SagB-type dehydrogenase family enzyme